MAIGFLGAGNMAGAIIRGLCAHGWSGSEIFAYDPDEKKVAALREACGIQAAGSPEELPAVTATLVVAVKPQVLPAALPPLREQLQKWKPLVLSIAAGTTLDTLSSFTGGNLPLCRVMPNLNATVGEAVSAYCVGPLVTAEHKALIERILQAFGTALELPEHQFSIFSALGGCSPAFTLLYIDALAEAGVRGGLTKAQALSVATQAVYGTAKLLQETGEHPRVLIDRVCSPGGTTIEGLSALQRSGFEAAVLEAAKQSCERDQRLQKT